MVNTKGVTEGMKYIIVKLDGTARGSILFGPIISHKEMAVAYGEDKVLGAGFCSFNWSPEDGQWKVNVWGRSVTLDMESKEEDAAAIKWDLNNTR